MAAALTGMIASAWDYAADVLTALWPFFVFLGALSFTDRVLRWYAGREG
jgi:hypothetical protein